MTEHKHAEVLRAIADGKEVEYYKEHLQEWGTDVDINPIWHSYFQWRIKPEPKPPIMVDDCVQLEDSYVVVFGVGPANIRFTFDPDTKLPIKVELI
jgi:hypothetical protein